MSEKQAKRARRAADQSFRDKIARLRPGMLPAPASILGLPVDKRGYFVPWFATVNKDGEPDFRIVDGRKVLLSLQKSRSFISGQPLERYKSFVLGPMCVINGISAEPPSRPVEARYAARVCPFLAIPSAGRREAGLDERDDVVAPPGIMDFGNPGVTCVLTTKSYSVKASGLIEVGFPTTWLEWYYKGEKVESSAEILDPEGPIQKALNAAEVKLFESAALDADPEGSYALLTKRIAHVRTLVRASASKDPNLFADVHKESRSTWVRLGFGY